MLVNARFLGKRSNYHSAITMKSLIAKVLAASALIAPTGICPFQCSRNVSH
jgi:hypothetical protein